MMDAVWLRRSADGMGKVGMLRLRGVVRFANGPTSLSMTGEGIYVLHPQLYYGGAGAAFVLRGFGYGFYVGMLLQQLAEGFAEDAHAAAVDYADAFQAGEEGAVDEAFDFAGGVVDGAADYVDFGGDVDAFGFGTQRH